MKEMMEGPKHEAEVADAMAEQAAERATDDVLEALIAEIDVFGWEQVHGPRLGDMRVPCFHVPFCVRESAVAWAGGRRSCTSCG